MQNLFPQSHIAPSKQIIKPPPSSLWSPAFNPAVNSSLFTTAPSEEPQPEFESVTVQQDLQLHAKDLSARIANRQGMIDKLQRELDQDKEALQLVQAKLSQQSPADRICRQWNRGECFNGSHCTYQHVCLTCKGPHNQMRCPEKEQSNVKSKEPCIKYNHNECLWGVKCHRQHICMSCGEQHRFTECPSPTNVKSKDICLNWNEGRCRNGDNCMRVHQCRYCRSEEHLGMDCDKKTPRLTTAAAPNAEVCANWNVGKCRASDACHRIHKCLRCGSFRHSAFKCNVVNRSNSDEQPVVLPVVPLRSTQSDSASPGKQVTQLNSNFVVGRHHSLEQEICLNYNNNKCQVEFCRRQHVCSLCRSNQHIVLQCPKAQDVFDYIAAGIEICFNFNQNRCHVGDEIVNPIATAISVGSQCSRLHCCNVCHQPHPQCDNH